VIDGEGSFGTPSLLRGMVVLLREAADLRTGKGFCVMALRFERFSDFLDWIDKARDGINQSDRVRAGDMRQVAKAILRVARCGGVVSPYLRSLLKTWRVSVPVSWLGDSSGDSRWDPSVGVDLDVLVPDAEPGEEFFPVFSA